MISRGVVVVGEVLVLVLSLSCAKPQKTTQKVTLHGGVIMQSGDVKPLARTRFLVYDADPLPQVLTLRDSAKVELDYDTTYKALEEELEGVIKRVHNSKELKALRTLATDICDSLYNEKKSEGFRNWIRTETDPDSLKTRTLAMRKSVVVEKRLLDSLFEIGNLDTFWYLKAVIKNQIADWNIGILLEKIENYRKIHRRISSKRAEFPALDDKLGVLWYKKAAEYLMHQAHMMLITSFSGKVIAELELGKSWILAATDIGLNRLVWAVEFEVTKETTVFEFSNDNSYSCLDSLLSSDDLYAIVSYASATSGSDSTAVAPNLY